MVAAYIEKVRHNMLCVTLVCLKDTINTFSSGFELECESSERLLSLLDINVSLPPPPHRSSLSICFHHFLSRLWSTYLDKFFLPDFWTLFGGKILNQSQPRPNKEELMCGSNVTFTQFVDYTFKVNEPHWNPVSSSCDPCQFKPQVIGKMETYSRDARALLDRAGAGWIVDDVDHDTHVRHELETLIQYNFMVIHNKSPQLSRNKCISDEGLGARLWKTFQYNGYISDKVVYQAPSPFTQESFKQSVFKGLEESARYGKQELREQKGRALRSAFKQLAETTMQRIASKYDMDFRMFGYSVQTFQ